MIKVVFESVYISLDGAHICNKVLVCSAVYFHLALALPVGEPVGCDGDVSCGIWATIKERFELWHVTHDDLNCLKNLLVVLSSKVSDSCADICFECHSIVETRFKVSLVVVSSESMDHSGSKISNFDGG